MKASESTICNCVLYARVSTDRQVEKDLSIPAQLRLMRAFAMQRKWKVVEEVIEPGLTATNVNRPALQDMLKRIESKALKTDIVLTHKLNRMSRNRDDYAPIRKLLQQHGARITSVVENIDDSPAGHLLENIMVSIAQFESANLADETKKGMRQLVLTGGWPHRPPRGYVMVRSSENRHLGAQCEIHPRDGTFITKAFELFASGLYSMHSLSERLANDGLLSETGAPISHSHMQRILTNPFYVGRISWQDVDVVGRHTPLVSATTFARVQAIVAHRRRSAFPRGSMVGLPLRGLAICATCRGRFTAERHGRFSYYRCSRQAYRRDLCDSAYCRADVAHKGIERVLTQLLVDKELAGQILAEADRLLAHKVESRELIQVRLRQEESTLLEAETRLTDAFASGDLSADVFKQKTRAIRERRLTIERQCEQQDGSAMEQQRSRVRSVMQLATSLADLYQSFNDVRRAELLRNVFATVVLSNEGLIGFTLQPTFEALKRTPKTDAATRRVAKSLLEAA